MTFEKIIAVQVITQVFFITHVEIFGRNRGRDLVENGHKTDQAKKKTMRHSSTAPTPPPCCYSTLHTSLPVLHYPTIKINLPHSTLFVF